MNHALPVEPILRELGLRERLVTGSFGVLTAAHLARAVRDGRIEALPCETRAAAVVALFVGGARLPRGRARALLGDALEPLCDADLLVQDDEEVLAPRAVLPVRGALLVCPWHNLPDDSSFHLLGCLPAAASRWLDIGTGAAIAPLIDTRPRDRIVAADIDGDSIEAARIGLALAGRGEAIDVRVGDLLESVSESDFDLITFNAPIEGAASLLARFYAEAPARLASGGEIVVHSLIEDATAPPERGASLRCRYTPEGSSPAFGVTWWWPHSEQPARLQRSVVLTTDRPHLCRDDLEPADFPRPPVSR